jgi:hypothetical protein
MKYLIILISIFLFFVQCKNGNITPETTKINGKWKLFKISSGFRPPNGIPFYEPTYIETLEITSKTNILKRTKNGVLEEETAFEVKPYKIDENVFKESLFFFKTNTYSFLDFEESDTVMVLYIQTEVGEILADGSSFYYKKL